MDRTHSGISIKNVCPIPQKPQNFEVFYLFLIFFTFSFPLLKKLNPANTANESQTIKNAIFIVKIDDNTQNQIDHIIFQRNVANCSAQEMSHILSFCACSVIIAETTGFITDNPKEMQNETTNIITNDKSNHNKTNNQDKNTFDDFTRDIVKTENAMETYKEYYKKIHEYISSHMYVC